MVSRLSNISDLADLDGPVNLAVGIFDGVHRGHAAVIGGACERPGTAVVMTFEPHPANVLAAKSAPGRITSLEHKQHLLEGLGVEFLIVVALGYVMTEMNTSVKIIIRKDTAINFRA